MMSMSGLERIYGYTEQLVKIRHDLHMHPELGFAEERTAGVITKLLGSWGIEVHKGIGKTGVVGVLRGRGDNGRRVGLRAELDALPLEEATGLKYGSREPGVFHGCGHDGHMAILLGAARYLAETRAFNGSVVFIFQPAEEGGGGARAMLADGLFDRFPCDEIYALHNVPTGPRGRIGMRVGPAMAAADFFDIKIVGRGSHAAQPQRSIDPIAVGVTLVQALQTILSRNIDPLNSAVLSVTRIQAGSTYNVIPETAHIAGTIRTFEQDVRVLAAKRLRGLAAGIGEAFDAAIAVEIQDVFSVLTNNEEQTKAAVNIASELFGAENVDAEAAPQLASEDFADMLKVVPGCYLWLSQTAGWALHNPKYVFDDAIIPQGAWMLASLAERRTA
jgi:hippurate hydrolase